MQKHTFKAHRITDDERLWLAEAVLPNFDPKVTKVKLLGKIAPYFDPNKIDRRLYVNGKLTAVGVWHLDSYRDEIFKELDAIVQGVRNQIVKHPGIGQISVDELAVWTVLPKENVARGLGLLRYLGAFFSSTSEYQDGTVASFGLSGDSAYDPYLYYTGIDDVVESCYVKAQQDTVQHDNLAYLYSNANPISSHNYWPSLETLPLTTKVIKPATAFVLMAIDKKQPELEDVFQAIKEVCKKYEIRAYRSSDIEHQEPITDVVLREIRECEHLIADLTSERPNVYYEVGYAHAHDKKPILYRKAGTRLHFDLSVHNVPEYENLTDLKNQLTSRFKDILGRRAKGASAKE